MTKSITTSSLPGSKTMSIAGAQENSAAKTVSDPPRPRLPPGTRRRRSVVKHKRRFCKVEGCHRIVKSQGVCQRHGAKPKMCSFPNCPKQAQGSYNGMCKAHFKENGDAITKEAARGDHELEKREQTQQPSFTQYAIDNSFCQPVVSNLLPEPVTSFLPVYMSESALSKPLGWYRNQERLKREVTLVIDEELASTPLEIWEQEALLQEATIFGNDRSYYEYMAHAWGLSKTALKRYLMHDDVAPTIEPFPIVSNAEFQKPVSTVQSNVQISQQKYLYTSAGPEKQIKPSHQSENVVASEFTNGLNEEEKKVGADAWDLSCYGSADYNECLVEDLMQLDPKDFETNTTATVDRMISVVDKTSAMASDLGLGPANSSHQNPA